MYEIYKNDKFQEIKNPVVTIGTFDGIHLGHQAIIKEVVKRAQYFNSTSIVVTFTNHPLDVVAPEKSPMLLTSKTEKEFLIKNLGIDIIYWIDFNKEIANLTAEEFIDNLLISNLKCREIVVGHNHGFGKGRLGNLELLKEYANKKNFSIDIVSGLSLPNGQIISSTNIRRLIKGEYFTQKDNEVNQVNSNLFLAEQMLGRRYSIYGKVVKGKGRGTKLGFPTANIELETTKKLLPPNGVYSALVDLDGKKYKSAVNIGTNPTFEIESQNERTIEVYILDFSEQIYGKYIKIEIVSYIRNEKKFETPSLLVEQMKKDVEQVRRVDGYIKAS